MKKIPTFIEDLFVIELDIFHDDRGFFTEKYNQKKFAEIGLNYDFVQDNMSLSKPKVLRGLHFQNNPSQAKLVSCVFGKIYDVAVDLRKNSKTYGQYFGVEISAQNGKMLMIPQGFAHGFSVFGSENAIVNYKVDNFYSKAGDGGIYPFDKDLNIDWKIAENEAILSQKDKILPKFKEL